MTTTIPVWIEWNTDPSAFPYKQWFYTSNETEHNQESPIREPEHAWDIQLRITRRVENSWNTYGELKLLQSDLPDALMEPEASFILWNGWAIATVTVMMNSSASGSEAYRNQPLTALSL